MSTSIWENTLALLSDEAQAQWRDNGTDDCKYRIQSCYNCRHWAKDITLMGDYAWNHCHIEERNWRGWLGTRFDCCCPDYLGYEKEPNITWNELWEHGLVQQMIEQLKAKREARGA